MAETEFNGIARVAQVGPTGMITLRADLSDQDMSAAIEKAAGAKIPGILRQTRAGEVSLLWMSPDELLILCPYEQTADLAQALTRALEGHHALVSDMSDARALFALHGEKAREVLAKLTPADVSPSALPDDSVRRTRLGQVAAGIWPGAQGEIFVTCFRSTAEYVFELLKTAAKPGSSVF